MICADEFCVATLNPTERMAGYRLTMIQSMGNFKVHISKVLRLPHVILVKNQMCGK